jgi:hypothetical protein
MAGNTTNTLTAQITATDDTTQNVPINFGTGNPAFDSSAAEFVRYRSFSAAFTPQIVITLITELYIKNTGVNPFTVSWTPNGGVGNNVIVLNPGDQIILFASPAGASTPGVSTFTLTPVGATPCLAEYFMGG